MVNYIIPEHVEVTNNETRSDYLPHHAMKMETRGITWISHLIKYWKWKPIVYEKF